MNLEKITSGEELVSLFPDKFNSNMDEIDSAVGDNTSDISALDTRLTTAEGDIDALEASLATGVTRVDVSNTYASVVNWYSVIGKFVVGVIQVTPNQTINNSAGEFSGGLPYPPYVDISLALHSHNTVEQKIQYAVLRANGQIGAYGAYTANVPVRATYVYRMLN